MQRLVKSFPLISEATHWEHIFRQQYPRLYNFFRYRLGDDQLAEDLTAEVFERAWRDRRRYRHDLGKFEMWLFGIARKVVADHFRKRARGATKQSLESVAHTLAAPERYSPGSRVTHTQDIAQLARLMARLDERTTELIALKYGGGLTNRQIANITGLTESNVGTILHRGVQRLRKAWEE